MEVSQGDEDGLLPLLRLHNWANFPLPISLFQTASLSPSRNRLLLLSHRHEALLVPLGLPNAQALARPSEPSPSPLGSPSYPFSCVNPLASGTPPSTPPKSSSRLSNRRVGAADESWLAPSTTGPHARSLSTPQFWSPPALSTPYATPLTTPSVISRRKFAHIRGNPLFEPLATPYFTPSSTPFFTFSPSPPRQSPSVPSAGPKFPSPFPFLSDIECFSWGCCDDGFAANRAGGPFRELLLTGGKEGLIIHAFCVKEGLGSGFESPTIRSPGVESRLDFGAKRTESGGLEGKRQGKWRNWGVTEFKRRQEEWRRLEEEAERREGRQRDSDEGRRHEQRGKRKLRSLDEKIVEPDTEGDREDVRGGDASTGFESFVVDAKLEDSGNDIQLHFSRHHSWPSSADVVSFRIAHDSNAFSHLIRFSQAGNGWGEGGSPSVRDEPRSTLGSNSEELGPCKLDNSGSPALKGTTGGEQGYEVSGILSNPSSNLIALVLARWSSEQSQQFKGSSKEGKIEVSEEGKEDVVHRAKEECGRWRKSWKGSSDLCVVIASVYDWGMKWISHINFECTSSGKLTHQSPWTDFELANEMYLGLKEEGCVYLWSALSGQFVACIDVLEYCGFKFSGGLVVHDRRDSNSEGIENNAQGEVRRQETISKVDGMTDRISDIQDKNVQSTDSPVLEMRKGSALPAREIDEFDEVQGQDESEQAVAERSRISVSSEVNIGSGKQDRFVQVAVTADCLLIAITDEQGLVYLVSVDEYFAAHPVHFQISSPPQPRSSCCDLRVLSSWEVAGSDIVGAKPCSLLPNRQWLNWSPQEKSKAVPNSTLEREVSMMSRQGSSRTAERESGPGPPTGSTIERLGLGASGFTSRVSLARHGVAPVPSFASHSKPLRRVFLPIKQSESFVGMALNAYGITRVAVSTKNVREFILVQNGLRVSGGPFDESWLGGKDHPAIQQCVSSQKTYAGEVLAFGSQGCLYLVSATALHVVLPPLPASTPLSSSLTVGREGPWWLTGSGSDPVSSKWEGMLPLLSSRPVTQHWQTEVLDRSLVYDGLEEAERLCIENGWSLQLLRLRRLQLALDYVRIDEIEQALEALVHVGAAEAGMPRVLFAAVELMLNRFGSDSELKQASRLLALAARFSTRLVRRHGMAGFQKQHSQKTDVNTTTAATSSPFQSTKEPSKFNSPSGVTELARFLEVIRSLQDHLQAKRRGPHRGSKGEVNTEGLLMGGDGKNRPIIELPAETPIQVSPDSYDATAVVPGEQAKLLLDTQDMARLVPASSGALVAAAGPSGGSAAWDFSVGEVPEEAKGRRTTSLESAGEMFARWEAAGVDAENVVRDALRAGRVPLAVVQLHRMRSKAFMDGSQDHRPEMVDVFQEVQEIGKGIVYELLCKGKTALAMAALRRLGEDIEVALYELAFGTVQCNLRKQAKMELRRHTRLGSHDFQLLEITSYLEGLYPSSSFWGTYGARQRSRSGNRTVDVAASEEEDGLKLQLFCHSKLAGDFIIECGEVDGVVLGSWNAHAGYEAKDDVGEEQHKPEAGYFVVAAVWLHAWDQRTVDRVILDQSLVTGEHTSWGAQLEYHVAHHNWSQVSALLDAIPHSVVYEGELHVHLDCDDAVKSFAEGMTHPGVTEEVYSDKAPQQWSASTAKAVIPKVHVLGINMRSMCSAWLWHMMEEKLAKSHIFLRTQWHGTSELVSLLATAGLLFHRIGARGASSKGRQQFAAWVGAGLPHGSTQFHRDSVRAVHELVVRHCVRHSLVNLLERYLNHHSLALDKVSAALMRSVVGNCEWAQWLLLSRLKGREYDASFANARCILAPSTHPGRNLESADANHSIATVNDMAAAGREIIALTTLMYAPHPLQKCLTTGSVNSSMGQSWQSSLENIQPGLQNYPTLWHSLVAASFGQDSWGFYSSPSPKAGVSMRGLPSYLEWRESLFASAAGDTSLLQMLPRWLPKRVRRLLQLSIQGPVGGGQAVLQCGSEAAVKVAVAEAAAGERAARAAEVEMEEDSVLGWEASIQSNIEEELYAPSSEEAGLGVEHHLRRGRALAALNSLLAIRAHTLGSSVEQSGKPMPSSSEAQVLLSSLTESEKKLIVSVLPLAITNYENTVIVAACACFLELCGLSAHLLRVDVAALRRIAQYLKRQDQIEGTSSAGATASRETTAVAKLYGADVAGSLARALADEYLNAGIGILSSKPVESVERGNVNRRPSKAVLAILQQLEKASLKDEEPKVEGSSGAWLLNASGDGSELRAIQRSMSERWSLVTAFCRAHQLPLSTTYLRTLARDNDWVGFLAEAQVASCPLDVLLILASKEFTDIRLQSHVLTVLKSLPAAPQKPSVVTGLAGLQGDGLLDVNIGMPAELFGLLAEYELRKDSGSALLAKAKELRWPLLAVVASCFSDVTALSCLTVWLEITAARETSAIRVTDAAAHISACVGAVVEATNSLVKSTAVFPFNRKNPKRRRHISPANITSSQTNEPQAGFKEATDGPSLTFTADSPGTSVHEKGGLGTAPKVHMWNCEVPSQVDRGAEQESLAVMVAVLCEQQRFVPLLRAFELFTPTSSLLPFIRFLQAFAQMRISEASAHLAAFSALLKEETHQHNQQIKNGKNSTAWITAAAVAAADAMLEACPSPYERRCLLQLLSAADFADGGMAAVRFRRFYWKMQLAEPALRPGIDSVPDGPNLDNDALLVSLETSGQWEEARTWAHQLDLNGERRGSAIHHVTETQAEAMVVEWKELLWDVPEERAALWEHCQALFTKHSFPPLRAGMFYLKHADGVEREVPTTELHGILLLALQWLSGSFTNTSPVYPLHLLHELETRVWLLAVESEVEIQNRRDQGSMPSGHSSPAEVSGSRGLSGNAVSSVSPVDLTASAVTVVDSHLKRANIRSNTESSSDDTGRRFSRSMPSGESTSLNGSATKVKRRLKQLKRTPADPTEGGPPSDSDIDSPRREAQLREYRNGGAEPQSIPLDESSARTEEGVGGWEERVGEGEVERAVLALVEVGQVTAAKQLQQKLSPARVPLELLLVDAAQTVAMLSMPAVKGSVVPDFLHPVVLECLRSTELPDNFASVSAMQVLNALTTACREGCGRGLCRRIAAVAQIANFLGLPFAEAFQKQPPQLLQLLSLKGQEALPEANLLVATHSMRASTIARILAEAFLKGLVAAHRGGYMNSSQREEGPAPLLWRPSNFKLWAQLCPSEPEVGHALMRLVISGRDMPHSCEVELIILAHHYYESSACLDGVDVLVALAATRVEAYVAEADFASLARLVTGVSNFQTLRFVLDLLIENGQLELLLQKRAAVDAAMESSASIRGFRMAVLSALKHFNPYDQDAFALVYSHFSMAHEMAGLLKSRARRGMEHWMRRHDPELIEQLLDVMRLFVEAAEVYAGIDAGNNTSGCCAQASLVSLQLRMPEMGWLNLTDTNARRLLVEQPRFPESLIVAEAYELNQSAEWVPVLWNQMLQPGRIDQFLGEFVAALPLPATMLMELARFYRAEVSARGDQLDFTKWLTPGGVPLELARYLGKSMRSLLKHVRDIRVRIQLSTVATGFPDVVDACMRTLDKVPDTAGPLILRKGHGGTYIPLM